MNEPWRRDLSDVALIGADVMLFMTLREVFEQMDGSEDPVARKMFQSLKNLADLVRIAEKES